jgi:hypothetical protein
MRHVSLDQRAAGRLAVAQRVHRGGSAFHNAGLKHKPTANSKGKFLVTITTSCHTMGRIIYRGQLTFRNALDQ